MNDYLYIPTSLEHQESVSAMVSPPTSEQLITLWTTGPHPLRVTRNEAETLYEWLGEVLSSVG